MEDIGRTVKDRGLESAARTGKSEGMLCGSSGNSDGPENFII